MEREFDTDRAIGLARAINAAIRHILHDEDEGVGKFAIEIAASFREAQAKFAQRVEHEAFIASLEDETPQPPN